MSMRDFNDWMQFYAQCGFPHTNQENLLARQAWQFAAANSGKGKAPKLKDYLVRKPVKSKHMTDDQVRAKAKAAFAMLGVKPDG